MIQRIQTLYLLIVSGLIVSLFFSNLLYIGGEPVTYTEYTPFIALTAVSLLVALATIFLYRHRILQMRLCSYNSLILLGYQCWIAVLFFTRETGTAFSATAVFPLICIILTLIALRCIARDEALVQSANSLRKSRRNKK